MADRILASAKNASLRAFLRGEKSVNICGITLTITNAHDNEYQVILPDMSEIFRIYDGNTPSIVAV